MLHQYIIHLYVIIHALSQLSFVLRNHLIIIIIIIIIIIKRLINRHPTTPLISRVTDDEEQSNTNGHLSLARKSRKCTCVCLLMMAIFLLVLVTLIAFEVAMTVSVAEVALKKQSDVEKIVAEGDSVSLCNIDQMYVNTIIEII